MKKNINLILVILLVFVAAAAGVFLSQSRRVDSSASSYSAVFLTNGQVYFGRIDRLSSQTIDLVDIFYLQVNSQESLQKTESSPDISLVKLGNELHGPTDKMVITREQVLFTESLKKDSKVVQAINNYKK